MNFVYGTSLAGSLFSGNLFSLKKEGGRHFEAVSVHVNVDTINHRVAGRSRVKALMEVSF